MSSLPQKLPGYPPLLTGESLSSYLIRLGKANFYQPLSILTELIFDGADDEARLKDRLDLPKQAAVFERIARLAQVEALQLYRASAHRFAHVITPPGSDTKFMDLPGNHVVPLLPEGVAHKLLRSASACQYCPLCVQQHPFHRLKWLIIATSVCLEHKCLLVNQCYHCNGSLRIRDVVNASCGKCGADLGKAPCIYIRDDECGLLAQQVIQAWLFNRSLSLPSKDYLPPQPPRALFGLLEGLRYTVQGLAKAGRMQLHTLAAQHGTLETSFKAESRSLTPYQSYCVYATAIKGIMRWPEGFYEFLDEQIGRRDNGLQVSTLQKDLGSFYMHWIQRRWLNPAFDFVQEAFNRYTAEHYAVTLPILHSKRFRGRPELLEIFSDVSINYAAELASVTPPTIQRLIGAGRLKTTREDPPLVRQVDVLKLRDTWNFHMGLEDVVQVLGVSGDVVLDMVSIGLLLPEHSPSAGFLSWQFHEKDICQLLERIKSHARVYEGFSTVNFSPIDLAGASRILTKMGLNAASILSQIAEGRLQAYREPSSPFSCQDLLFDHRDLSAYMKVMRAEQDWMSRREVTQHLKIKDGTLAKWVKAGILMPTTIRGNTQYFDKTTVEQFAPDHITCKQAAVLLNVRILTVQKWVRMGRLQAISGPGIDDCHDYLFDKASLLPWRNERLSFGEALHILGVSRATLHRWVDGGRIAPLDDMGGKQRWFSREAILILRQEMVRKHTILIGASAKC